MTNISIHTSREGCDAGFDIRQTNRQEFQSTHPARDVTSPFLHFSFTFQLFQSTHPARDVTPFIFSFIE